MGLLARVASAAIEFALQRPYYHLRHADGSAYMDRYWLMPKFLLRRRLGVDDDGYPQPYWDRRFDWLPTVRIHHIMSSDWDRHLHDHPFASMSLILRGRYIEIMPRYREQPASRDNLPGGQWRRLRKPGDIIFRSAVDRHRLEIIRGESCWSLFAMGRKTRSWGFYTEAGWVPHCEYNG